MESKPPFLAASLHSVNLPQKYHCRHTMNRPFKASEHNHPANDWASLTTADPDYDGHFWSWCLDIPFSSLYRPYPGPIAHHELLFQVSNSVLQKAWLSSQT